MNKMLKKLTAAAVALFTAAAMTGCSDYVMTEKDLAKQKSIEGFWAADDSTGYNSYDENGNLTDMIVIEFTDDFHYLMHECMLGSEPRYALSHAPIAYSFEEEKFKVVNEGVAAYAEVYVSDDGQTMQWRTDEKTDTYLRMTEEKARELGIPEYDPESWKETVTGSGSDSSDTSAAPEASGSDGVSEGGESTESESGTDQLEE